MIGGVEVVALGGDREQVAAVAERLATDGVAVTTETDPVAALARLDGGGPDCLVVIATGDADPLALAGRVEDHPVVVAGGEDGPDPPEALAAGADEFVRVSVATDAPGLLAGRVGAVVGAVRDRSADRDRPANRDRPTDRDRPAGRDWPADRDLLAALDVPTWLVRDGEVAYANPVCAELFGYGPGELAGKPVAELVVPSDREAVAEHVESLAAGDVERRTDELTSAGMLGRRIRVEVTGRRLDDGTVLGRLAEVAGARIDERRVDALFEHLEHPVADVALADARATVRRVNPAFAETFGVEGDAVVGEDLLDRVVPSGDDHEQRAFEVYHRAERGQAVAAEVTRTTADGRLDVELQALPYEGGLESRALLVYVDVSERAERERSLTELQAATRELLAATDRQAVARIGVESAERVLGVEVAVVYGFDGAEDALVPLAATDGARALFGESSAIPRGGGPTWYVYEMGDPVATDDVRTWSADLEPDRPVRSELLVPLGEHGIFVAGSTEVGAFDDADEALARTLGSALETAFDRTEGEQLLRERERELRRQNERLDEFAGVVSHDLRGPLTVVKGNAHLLRKKGDAKYLDRIEAAADRMEQLIEDLLALARQGATVDETEPVDLRDVVEEAWSTADTRAATLAADADASIEADPGRLRQLFENLFNNAVEHGGDDVTVRVGTMEAPEDERPGGRYGRAIEGFFVADDGPGLPEDGREELFEPGATTDDGGTGFGLAIVKRVAEAHGWTVTAGESERSGGVVANEESDGSPERSSGGARFEFTGVDGS